MDSNIVFRTNSKLDELIKLDKDPYEIREKYSVVLGCLTLT